MKIHNQQNASLKTHLPECQQEDIGAAFADEEPIDEGDGEEVGDEEAGDSSDNEAVDE